MRKFQPATLRVRRRRAGAFMFAATFAIALVAAPGLTATAATSEDPDAVATALEEALPEAFEGLSNAPTSADGDTAVALSEGSLLTKVPTEAGDGIKLATAGEESVTVSLPFADRASDAEVLQNGLVAYNNNNGSSTVASLKDDTSVQIASVIDSPSSPDTYRYKFNAPSGSSLRLVEDGGAELIGDDGEILLHIYAPVARNVDGETVETHYETNGLTLTQVVNLEGVSSFPVVADPFLGRRLIKNVTVTYPYSDKSKYKVNVTPWGNSEVEYVGVITWGAWESELKTRLGSNASKVTYVIREQLNCHLAGYPLSLPEFNLESWRKSMSWSAMAPYNCNYPEGGWGSKS